MLSELTSGQRVAALAFRCSVTECGMPTAPSRLEPIAAASARAAADIAFSAWAVSASEREAQLVVPEIHCAGCSARIERALTQLT